jgi:pimeloyl-ACP methyl ester carboxylesterase
MLSAHASEDARAWVRWNMARIVPAGYAQATHLLANADLASDLARYRGRIAVAVGADDTITPPAACERIAEAARVSLRVIPHAGHAGYVESPAAYTTLIEAFCRASGAPRSI